MSMYLPNPAVVPTAYEAGEFLDIPPMADAARRDHEEPTVARRHHADRPDGADGRLDLQTRLNIARWADEYINGLVENHHGTPADVRSIVHALHDPAPIAGRVLRLEDGAL
jgi:hypothetical protein